MGARKRSSQSHDDLIGNFVAAVQENHAKSEAKENACRSAFESLFAGLRVNALNEPKRENCGAPDFLVFRGDIVIGHFEAKDLDVGIRGMKGRDKCQQDRYKAALPNLHYTNALDWDFYLGGNLKASVIISGFLGGIIPKPER
ncbi:MAG: hypothetical protein F4186_09915 [Boseongicola sp. SB0676_bin_33]|uniref:DNA methyltransferase n=1 Tax=Boseongicola sp. SB0664_bin_43 TaxID=2604844 RepID=A0A6B0Y418_9RHOB|nr:hypothetical protein [Boseongicola sp. SB0664_bin_43]MYF89620.1 hypothetical protein [Boseongicola sp. SB0676_bin_33]